MVIPGFRYYDYSFKAMGSNISLKAEIHEEFKVDEVFNTIENVFKKVEKVASRFIEGNDLHILNNSCGILVKVDEELFNLVYEAYLAYRKTGGLFDPRILNNLTHNGYVKNFNFNSWEVENIKVGAITSEWLPLFDKDNHSVNIGDLPIDLGGIGKSYTVWLAYLELVKFSSNFFINGGGDILFAGKQEDGSLWTVGVENPFIPDSMDYIAVLNVSNVGVATSSLSKRSWVDSNGNAQHHIIDPSTGLSADNGIMSVTVVHDDVVYAEIWSKSLFLKDKNEINDFAYSLNLPVLWVTDEGQMFYNELMSGYISL